MGKIIEFTAHHQIVEDKQIQPIPTKLNIPEWFKKLKHTEQLRTLKGCIPFLETITTGYLLKLPQDFYVEHNTRDVRGQPFTKQTTGYSTNAMPGYDFIMGLNAFENVEHPLSQVGGKSCPFSEKNKQLPIQKFLNPWFIKTPPGYSCLFVPPLNNSDDRFSIISGIVHTDKFDQRINFPYLYNGDKYPYLETTLKKGTPFVQVIPFKRDSWKMKVTGTSTDKIKKSLELVNTLRLWFYKTKFWDKGVNWK
tara:strand:+ start:469 stop:1221 length:753 start_codon:yes stop_codon:yes gene_type:complete